MTRITLIFVATIVFSISMACAQKENKSTTENGTNTTASTVYKDVNAETFKSLMEKDNVVIVDVRTDREVAEGMIEGAIQLNINDSDFISKVAELDKDKEILVYCKSGGRSSRACKKMQDMGFAAVYNLEGGYSAWPYKK